MVDKKSWKEFQKTGLLLIINQLLHVFGWCIVFDLEDNKIISVYPARTKFRGFDNKSVEENYIKVSEYINENSKILLEEAKS